MEAGRGRRGVVVRGRRLTLLLPTLLPLCWLNELWGRDGLLGVTSPLRIPGYTHPTFWEFLIFSIDYVLDFFEQVRLFICRNEYDWNSCYQVLLIVFETSICSSSRSDALGNGWRWANETMYFGLLLTTSAINRLILNCGQWEAETIILTCSAGE